MIIFLHYINTISLPQKISGLAVLPNSDDDNDASSSIFRQAGQATADDGPVRRTITMYRDGFTVDDGPYRRLDDPNNAEFLSSLARGVTPRELSEGGEDVTVGLVDKRGEEYDPSAAPSGGGGGGGFQSFSGAGNSLGTATSSSGGGESSNGVFVPDASATAPTLDASRPSTSIQVRLLNGKRLVVKVNLDASVSSLGEHIDANGASTEPYVLVSGYPPRPLTDLGQSIESAGLKGAQVMQKKA